MRNTNFKVIHVIHNLLFLCLVLVLASCQAAKATPASALFWQVELSRYEVKADLKSVEAVIQYDGSKIDVTHTQNAGAGNVYLIMEVKVSKTENPSTAPFDWQGLVVRDASGNSYHRLENDTFLERFKYTPRITGLQLRLGEYSGWMGYEIPAAVANGKLTLSYTGAGSQQEIVVQK
jgi:hypothetical protein